MPPKRSGKPCNKLGERANVVPVVVRQDDGFEPVTPVKASLHRTEEMLLTKAVRWPRINCDESTTANQKRIGRKVSR